MFLISAPALAAGLWNVVRPSRTPPVFSNQKLKYRTAERYPSSIVSLIMARVEEVKLTS